MFTPIQLHTMNPQGRGYTCDLLWVCEILRQPVITPVDPASPTLLGQILTRPEGMIALLDIGALLSLPATENP